jgi:hypothetical protein
MCEMQFKTYELGCLGVKYPCQCIPFLIESKRNLLSALKLLYFSPLDTTCWALHIYIWFTCYVSITLPYYFRLISANCDLKNIFFQVNNWQSNLKHMVGKMLLPFGRLNTELSICFQFKKELRNAHFINLFQ